MADGLTCPSARAVPGAVLVGVVDSGGRVVPMRTTMRIDKDFVETASKLGPPEARMRFAGKCHEGGCAQWTGSRCGVIDRVLGILGPEAEAETALQPCVIRATCRWYAQSGRTACAGCAYVVTDTRAPVAAE